MAQRIIVVPVDLERHTSKLVDFAVSMANRLDCGISFFHGVEFEYGTMGDMVFGDYSYEEYNIHREEQAKKKVDDIVRNASGRCKNTCSGEIAFGYVVDEIVEHARKVDAELIIIGTHGRRALEKILLGSVAENVIKRAHCPTLVMNPYR